MLSFFRIAALSLLFWILPAGAQGSEPPLRLACLGDSTTFGSGIDQRESNSYPAQLQVLLGEQVEGASYLVGNFGVSGTTALPGAASWQDAAFEQVAEFAPDIAVISLGTNDCKPRHIDKEDADFAAALTDLVHRLRALPHAPQVYLCQPVPVAVDWAPGPNSIQREPLDRLIRPLIDQVAAAEACQMIDLNTPLIAHPEMIPDGVHPDARGARIMAQTVLEAVAANIERGGATPERLEAFGINVQVGDYQGSVLYSFDLGVPCQIAVPENPASGRPWIWRARFWAHEPQFEAAMLERGWAVAYCDVADLFGNEEALARWDRFYALMQGLGFSNQPLLEGMSRGGLPVMRWAIRHPAQLSGIYLDNAVMDIRSWPGGLGSGKGAAAEWQRALAAYGLDTETVTDFTAGPLDHLAALAAAEVPIMALINLADEVVPAAENGEILAQRYSELGGPIQVIRREGLGHHPHSLKDPSPLVEFAEDAWDAAQAD